MAAPLRKKLPSRAVDGTWFTTKIGSASAIQVDEVALKVEQQDGGNRHHNTPKQWALCCHSFAADMVRETCRCARADQGVIATFSTPSR